MHCLFSLNVLCINNPVIVYRVYPYLCRAVRNYVIDHSQTSGLPAKEYYVSFVDVSRRLKLVLSDYCQGLLLATSFIIYWACTDSNGKIQSCDSNFTSTHNDNIWPKRKVVGMSTDVLALYQFGCMCIDSIRRIGSCQIATSCCVRTINASVLCALAFSREMWING